GAVPSGRDLAFVRFDGFMMTFVRQDYPHLTEFEDRYPGSMALEWQARRVDRRYLSDLDWAAWQPVVASLQSSLTDAVIDAAARRPAAPYAPLAGQRGGGALQSGLTGAVMGAAVARLPAPYVRLDGELLAARLKSRRERLPEA